MRPFGVHEWLVAREGMELVAGDALRTWAGSGVEIRYIDGLVLTIQPESHVEIDSVETTGVEGGVRFAGPAGDETVLRGQDNSLGPVPGQPRKGTFETTDEGGTIVKQTEGRSTLRTRRDEIVIGPRERVDVGPDGRPGARQALPPAPSPIAPVPNGEISVPDPARARVPFTWTVVPGASGYRVKVHGDAVGGPLLDRVVAAGQTTLVADPLPAGRYYWEVSTIVGEAEGVSSDLAAFTIRAVPAAAGPPLAVDRLTPRGNTVYVEGRTDEGARLTINGTAVGVDAEGRFREHIVLPASGRIVLRAVDARGGATEVLRIVPRRP